MSRPSQVADFGTGLIVHARELRPTAETPPQNFGGAGDASGSGAPFVPLQKAGEKGNKTIECVAEMGPGALGAKGRPGNGGRPRRLLTRVSFRRALQGCATRASPCMPKRVRCTYSIATRARVRGPGAPALHNRVSLGLSQPCTSRTSLEKSRPCTSRASSRTSRVPPEPTQARRAGAPSRLLRRVGPHRNCE